MKNLFRIHREERFAAALMLIYTLALNAMVIAKYYDRLHVLMEQYYKPICHTFHISGFDPLSYVVVSQWFTYYNIYRHPLLAFFMYPLYLINQGLIAIFGVNCAQFVVAALLVFCSFYSFIFLYRIFREIVGIGTLDSWLLGAFTFSCAYVMVSISVPDHFCLSMFLLILTLYISGRKMQSGKPMTIWQTILLFILTAGVSLNNGIKIFLAGLFTNGRRFFRPAYLLLAILLPSFLIWKGARMEWQHFEKPQYIKRQHDKAIKRQREAQKTAQAFQDKTSKDKTSKDKASKDKRSKKVVKKKRKSHMGKPIAKGEFSQWTDISTPRWPSAVENLFGESMQLHRDHLLLDGLYSRPVIVYYDLYINYIVEGIIVLLFIIGIFCGRRSRFLWLALSWFGFDMLIHFVLGFGLNEIYIMSAHWLFIIATAIAYIFVSLQQHGKPSAHAAHSICASRAGHATRGRWSGVALIALRSTLLTTTLFLFFWNISLYVKYLLG